MMTATIKVDPARCCRCGLCIRECMAKILVRGEKGIPATQEQNGGRCFGCQHCLAVCPTGALSWSGKRPEESDLYGPLPTPDELIHLFQFRHSIRLYKEANVERTMINELLDAMRYVPTGCNDHRLYFSYSETREATDVFREMARTSVLNMVAGNRLPNAISHFARCQASLKANQDVFFHDAPHFVAISVPPDAKDAHIDPYIAATHFELLATCLGLGTCWAGMATDLFQNDVELLTGLDIPAGYDLKIMMLFGWPAIQFARATQPEICGRTCLTDQMALELAAL